MWWHWEVRGDRGHVVVVLGGGGVWTHRSASCGH